MTIEYIERLQWDATATVAARTDGRTSDNQPVLTQRDIDRLGPDYIPQSPWWRICKEARGVIAPRSWLSKAWARVTR